MALVRQKQADRWRKAASGRAAGLAAALALAGACTAQNVALALLPHATPRPPSDPMQPLVPPRPPPPLARQAEAGQSALPTNLKIDFATSAVAAMLWILGGSAPLFGLAGTFDENDLLAPGKRRSVRDSQRRAPAAPGVDGEGNGTNNGTNAGGGAARDEEDLRRRGQGYTPGTTPAPPR